MRLLKFAGILGFKHFLKGKNFMKIQIMNRLFVGIGMSLALTQWAQSAELVLSQREVRSIRVEALGPRYRSSTEASYDSRSEGRATRYSAWGSASAASRYRHEQREGPEFRILIRYRINGQAGHATIGCETRSECQGLLREIQQALHTGENVVVNVDENQGARVWLQPAAPSASATPVCNHTPVSYLSQVQAQLRVRLTGEMTIIPAGEIYGPEVRVTSNEAVQLPSGMEAMTCRLKMKQAQPYDRQMSSVFLPVVLRVGSNWLSSWPGLRDGYYRALRLSVSESDSELAGIECIESECPRGYHPGYSGVCGSLFGQGRAESIRVALEAAGVATSIGTDSRCQAPQTVN